MLLQSFINNQNKQLLQANLSHNVLFLESVLKTIILLIENIYNYFLFSMPFSFQYGKE